MNVVGFVLAIVLAVVILGLAFIVLSTYNEIVGLAQRIDKAWANIDVALKQRYDELPNLVQAVPRPDGLRAERPGAGDPGARRLPARCADPPAGGHSEQTTGAVKSLLAVVEHYPDLTAHENVMALQAEIARLEGVIADRRELYNDMVYRYDARIQQVPAVLLASILRLAAAALLQGRPGPGRACPTRRSALQRLASTVAALSTWLTTRASDSRPTPTVTLQPSTIASRPLRSSPMTSALRARSITNTRMIGSSRPSKTWLRNSTAISGRPGISTNSAAKPTKNASRP